MNVLINSRYCKLLFSIFISLLCNSSLYSQQSGIVWQKALLSNFDTTNSGIIFQGITTDSSNNIYFCQGLNNSDTSSSIISKFSPNGELLWRRTLLPNNQYQGLHTQFDYSAKILIDEDNNLIFYSKGYEVSTGNVLLLFKFDLNGNFISKGGLPITVNNSTSIKMGVHVDNGNIYFPIYDEMIDTGRLKIYCFDKNFNFLNTKTFEFYKSTHGTLVSANNIRISIQDSLLTVISSDVNPDYTELRCVGLFNNKNNLYYTENSYKPLNNMFKRGNQYIAFGGNGFIKFDTAGNKVFEYYNESCYGFNLDNDYLNFSVVYYSTNFIPIPILTVHNRYNIFTDSIYSFSPAIPQSVSAISFLIERSGINFYSSGIIQDDTINQFNGIRTYFFSKLDSLGNTLDYFYSTTTNPGWTQDRLVTCIDRDKNIVSFQSLRKPADSTPVKIFNYISKGSFNRIANLNGTCYFDENNNCIRDSTENAIPNNIVHLMPEDIYTSTDNNGRYSFTKLEGNANIEIIPINNNALCDTQKTIPCFGNIIFDSLDFGYKPNQNLFCSASIHNFVARPGFYPKVCCFVNNKNPFTIYNVYFTVLLDSAFQYINSDFIADSIIGNTLYYHLDSIQPNNFKKVFIGTYLPPTVPLGYNFIHQIQLETQTKIYRCFIKDTTTGITVGSYDPNDKIVEPIGKGQNNLVSNNSKLKYTIRFQNTGNDTAFNIKIIDEIDKNLDLNTFSIIASSHPMIFKLENRLAKFYFNNILLIDSNKSQDLSKGFIEFSILPKQNIDGAKIYNKADIYFDYNTPITTNTTYITIGDYIEPKISLPFNMTIYPNPNPNADLNIKLDILQKDNYTVNITDFTGRIIYTLISNYELPEGSHKYKIDLSQLSSGMYFIKIKSNKYKYNLSRKLLVTS